MKGLTSALQDREESVLIFLIIHSLRKHGRNLLIAVVYVVVDVGDVVEGSCDSQNGARQALILE